MELNKLDKVPPRLPNKWSSSYISYWQPMLPEDDITSGYCWFDYTKNVCRIDGLFNPWSEAQKGHRLWMSEIMYPSSNESFKAKVAYTRAHTNMPSEFIESVLNDEVDACHELILTQDVLIQCNAQFIGLHDVLGQSAEAWTFERPHGKGPATYYFATGTNQLLRMITGDPNVHASVRDFPNFNTLDIPASTFDVTKLKSLE
ncbi:MULTISPECIES: violacein biosynthesis enzyme VioE [Pseudoalteromonas]|uniref:Violacein biosynthesis enzyme VioE n=1 Tax=Pseudoalteromonas amylolytica TaxID=1859457 RepID=A0A1S1MS82_9GAMM|nr:MULTISPECIES: violacein biosynthesis enzyme VioE [Pseudoalteromonas]OHU86544.1 violacein biosynthesis enzyme VioE [Pseudoalteromonas sp. JW3]OHU88931.1 violacein biosynthesis enzyme VioE [Pseudoalteromonas amylolytica]